MSTAEIQRAIEEFRCKVSRIEIPCHSSLFVDMPLEWLDCIEKLLRLLPTDTTVTDKFRVSFKHCDLLRLNPGVWLNDEVINFFMKLCEERETKASRMTGRSNLYMNSFFYQKLICYGEGFKYSSVEKWTKGIDVFTYNQVFIPIHAAQHWSIVHVSMLQREIAFLDSLGKDGEGILKDVLRWLKEEYASKHKSREESFGPFSIKKVVCPRQMNGDDCGVFALAFVDLLANELPINVMTQCLCERVRKLIAFWIVRGHLV